MLFVHACVDVQDLLKIHLHGVLWPTHWLYTSDETDDAGESIEQEQFERTATPLILFKNKYMISSDILYHLATLCTFGICSPFLATIITVSLIIKLLTWIVVLGRFLNMRAIATTPTPSPEGDEVKRVQKFVVDEAVVALSHGCVCLLEVFDVTLWPIIWSSCWFFAVLTFDIAADEVVSASPPSVKKLSVSRDVNQLYISCCANRYNYC